MPWINTLDYSAYTSPVSVTLPNGPATNMGSIARIQMFIEPNTSVVTGPIMTNSVSSIEFNEYTVDETYNINWYLSGFEKMFYKQLLEEIFPVYYDDIFDEDKDFQEWRD